MAMIGGSLMIAAGQANAAPASSTYDLSQCANGGNGTLAICGPQTQNTGYVTGDLNPSNSHWAEGDFVPFQLQLNGIAKGSYVVSIAYRTVDNAKHAYDYLGSFDATETTSSHTTLAHDNQNNPCDGILASCDPTSPDATINIPKPDLSGLNATCDSTGTPPSLPSSTGHFSLWGPNSPTLDSIGYESPMNAASHQGSKVSACYTTIDVGFTATQDNSTLVLAWAGHVASALDWGPNTGAGSISGAPYHMAVAAVTATNPTTNTVNAKGAQDRSMMVSSLQPTMSTVIEDAAGTPVTTVPVNTPVHDTASLSGASSTAGGTVTYQLFNTGNCTPSENPNFPTSSVVTVKNGVVPNSTDFTPTTAPGEYSYLVTYSGDPGNEAAVATCEGPLGVTEAAAPIVNVVKSEPTPGDGTTVAPGQKTPITYKLAVTNSGTAEATSVVVTDAVPTGTTYVDNSASGPAGVTVAVSNGTITWTIPTLAAITGTTPTEDDLTFQVTVNSSDANGSTISNQAAFTDINTPSCTAGTSDTCLTNAVTNPVAVKQTGSNPQGTPQTAPPDTVTVPPATTTTTLKPALAFTGAHTGLLSLLGAGLIGTGGAVLALSRRRRPSGKR